MKIKKSFNRSAVLTSLCLLCGIGYAQNVGINTTGAAPNVSALLDVDAAPTNDKGILIPRVGLTQTTSNAPVGASVATSLMVYNTATVNDVTPGYYYWDGTKWVRLLGNNNAWLLLGNAGTTAVTNFIGTTDMQELIFKTNGNEAMRIGTNSNVAIGAPSTTGSKLFVYGGQTSLMMTNAAVASSPGGYGSNGLILSNIDQTANTTYSIKFMDGNNVAPNFGIAAAIEAVFTAHNVSGNNTGELTFTTANAGTLGEKMRITSVGRVGIGTSTPDAELEVISTLSSMPRGTLVTQYNSAVLSDAQLWLRKARGTETAPLAIQANDEIGFLKFRGFDGSVFSTNDQTEMGALATENWTTAANGSCLKFMTTANGTTLGAERMRIDQNGNVGIGTTTPTQNLQIGSLASIPSATPNTLDLGGSYSSTPGANLKLRMYDDGTNVYGLGISSFQLDYSISNNNINNRHVFYYGTTELMRIQGNGNVGIGTAGPLDKLTVSVAPSATPIAAMSIDVASFITVPNSQASYFFRVRDVAAGNFTPFYIQGDGNVGIGGTTTPTQALHVAGNICYTGGIGACSDMRYKKNFNPLENALQNVLKMNGLTYNWRVEEFPDNKFTTDNQIGFIAQDLEKIYPEVVITDKNGYKSVDYAKLTPILVEAIKEQQKIIESQQSSINNLKSENTNFKAQYDNRLKVLEEIIGTKSAQK